MIPRSEKRPDTIVLVGDLDKYHKEGRATQSGILPGMLLDILASSTDLPHTIPNVAKHATAGKDSPVRIVKERYLDGGGVNDAYEYDEATDPDTKAVVLFHVAQRGDIVLCRVAAGTNWANGTQLGSAGNGLFAASGTKRLVEVAEDYDDSAGSGTTLLRCEVL